MAKQLNKYIELKQTLNDAEEHIDSLELQLREQYQLVDELEEKVETLTRALGKKLLEENRMAFETLADEDKAKEENRLRKELSKKTKEKIIDLYLQTKFERDYLQVRVGELEDKDWYEGMIKQLEDQADRLVKERDTYHMALKEACEEIRLLNKNLKYNLMSEEFETKRQIRLDNLETEFYQQAQKERKNV